LKIHGYRDVKAFSNYRSAAKMQVNQQFLQLTPPENLSVLYAPPAFQSAFRLLLAFDNRLADTVINTKEPIITQMKLAWWNDVISMPPEKRPTGEPMVEELNSAAVEDVGDAMLELADSWGVLAASDNWTGQTLERFAELRSSAVFGTYARWVGVTDVASKHGKGWALDSLSLRSAIMHAQDRPEAIRVWKSDKILRPLSILALSAKNRNGPRLVWHALTGR
jgi:phytoene synthase